MSRTRGLLPLALAAGIGIANGIWVFKPAFQEEQEEKENRDKKALEVAEVKKSEDFDALLNAESDASRSLATNSALKPLHSGSSWWPKATFWSSGDGGNKKPEDPNSKPNDSNSE